ncbi:MAG: HdeD family acid-resistance protein [Sphingobacteriales bacterium]
METTSFKAVHNIVDHWWLILLSGLLLIGMGVWVILLPVPSYIALSFTFSFIVLAAGLFEIVFSIVNYRVLNSWGWTLTGGIIDLIIGLFLLLNPGVTMVVLPLIFGFWILFRGIIAVGNAINIRRYGFSDWGWLLITGLIIIILASLIFVDPGFGAATMVVLIEIAFIFAGIFRIVFSLMLRKFNDEFKS